MKVTSIVLFFLLQQALAKEKLELALLPEGFERSQIVTLEAELNRAGFLLIETEFATKIAEKLELSDRFNLSLREASALGLALGTDGYLLARLGCIERFRSGKTYTESTLLAAAVLTRSGKAIDFYFFEAEGNNCSEATAAVLEKFLQQLPKLADSFRQSFHEQFVQEQVDPADRDAVRITEATDDKLPPQIVDSTKPTYTPIAEKLSYSARVELEVVLRADGSIGRIKVLRWACCGLVEAAQAAVKKLRFRPASVAGKPVNCLATIVYNFNYLRQAR
ncbi:MAG: energy transducer TonB [Acidobacteriota bacterium]|nr:energy transducer TonB [Blastocatellia bacterium]MDW8412900.1 energy transducer TonB [Acidobacteriota bacterium]